MGEPQVSGIQFIGDRDELGSSIKDSLNNLADLKLRDKEVQENKDRKLEDALTIVTSGMAARDAQDINSALQGFINETKEMAKQYQGDIPFDKWADIKAKKANIEMMVKKSANDYKELANINKTMRTTGRNYIDQEATNAALEAELKKPLLERGDFWDTIVEHVDPIEILQKKVNKHQSGGYKINGNKIEMSKSNNPDVQIRAIFNDDQKFRRAIESRWQNSPSGYATPEDYAVGVYTPLVEKSNESVKANGTSRSSSSTSVGGRGKKQYTYSEADGTYNFALSPLRIHDLKDDTGRSLGTFSISKLKERPDGSYVGIGTNDANVHYTYESLKNAADQFTKGEKVTAEVEKMAKLFTKIKGSDDKSRKEDYDKRLRWMGDDFKDPNRRAGETMEIELGPEEVALVKEEISKWNKVEAEQTTTTKKTTTNSKDPKGYLKSKTDPKGYLSKKK